MDTKIFAENAFDNSDLFVRRHIGPRPEDGRKMLEVLGLAGMDELIEKAVPASIRLQRSLQIGDAHSEFSVINEIRELASQNKIFRSYIGMGYYNCITPRYPAKHFGKSRLVYAIHAYQAEISQGTA